MAPPHNKSHEEQDFLGFLLSLVGKNNDTSHNDSFRGDALPYSHTHSSPDIIALSLSAISILANLSGLLAIKHGHNGMSANLKLMVSLCLSDVFIGVCVIVNLLKKDIFAWLDLRYNTYVTMVLHGLRMTSHIISLLNLFGLALDHYHALIKPLSHHFTGSFRHTWLSIVAFWIMALLCGFSDFFLPLLFSPKCRKNTNKLVNCSDYNSEYLMFAIVFLLLFLLTFIYVRVFLAIRKHRTFQQKHQQHWPRSRRGLVTTLLILFTYVLCWLPYCLFEIVALLGTLFHLEVVRNNFKLILYLDDHLYNLLILNCLCDPIIYAARMKEVKRGYKRLSQSVLNLMVIESS